MAGNIRANGMLNQLIHQFISAYHMYVPGGSYFYMRKAIFLSWSDDRERSTKRKKIEHARGRTYFIPNPIQHMLTRGSYAASPT